MNSNLDMDELQFPLHDSINIPVQIIEALIDMEEYDGFCAFCHQFWIENNQPNMQDIIFETLLTSYLIN
ncbi:MAG: hypothetical protein IPG21_10630 [Saprospiraceae bacterium]|nr:hypothetical protein [Candidatus Vicinibacter affinis]